MLEFIITVASPFMSAPRRAAWLATLRLEKDNTKIADAEALLARLETERVEHAKANAEALQTALTNAAGEWEKSKLRLQSQIDRQNDNTNDVIAELEKAIATARRLNAKKLSKLAVRHAAQRTFVAADARTAREALKLMKTAAADDE